METTKTRSLIQEAKANDDDDDDGRHDGLAFTRLSPHSVIIIQFRERRFISFSLRICTILMKEAATEGRAGDRTGQDLANDNLLLYTRPRCQLMNKLATKLLDL